MKPEQRASRRTLVLGVLCGLIVGMLLHRGLMDESALLRHLSLRSVDQATAQLIQHYQAPLNQSTLTEAAIQGMVNSLDEYSEVLDAQAYARLMASTRGTFAGVGMQVGLRNGSFAVLSLLPDSPAAAANIQVGDVITKIEGAVVTGWRLSQVVDQLRGSSGSVVNLQLQRSVPDGPLDRTVDVDVVLVRQMLEAVYLRTRLLENRIAYARADQCYDTLAADLTSALYTLTELATENHSDTALRGLVLDLRANPGGSLTCAVTSVDLFIDSGTIVTTEGHQGIEFYQATSSTPFALMPLAILVDGGTASAAEIIAGALQDYGRATIVGGQTFAKGSVQTLLPPLANGSALKITTAYYRTPKGRSFSEVGLMPDVKVNALDERAVLAAALQVVEDQADQAQTPNPSNVE